MAESNALEPNGRDPCCVSRVLMLTRMSIAGLRPGEKKEAIDAAQSEGSASPRGSGVIMVSMTSLPAKAYVLVVEWEMIMQNKLQT